MVYMYHRFLVHSSADGHLGCFHVLAMTNSALQTHLTNKCLLCLCCVLVSVQFWGVKGAWALQAEIWMQILALPLIICVTLVRLLNHSKRQFPHRWNGSNNNSIMVVRMKWVNNNEKKLYLVFIECFQYANQIFLYNLSFVLPVLSNPPNSVR